MLPYRLHSGIFFEDTGSLLPWGAPFSEVLKIDNPETFDRETTLVLRWSKKKWLDGLRCTVISTYYRDWQRTDKLQVFGEADLSFHLGDPSEPFEEHRLTVEALSDRLGDPTEEVVIYDTYPHAEWQLGEVNLTHMVFERFGAYCTSHVKHVRHAP